VGHSATYWAWKGAEDELPPDTLIKGYANGWLSYQVNKIEYPQSLKSSAVERSRRTRGPLLAAMVEDSDYAYVVGATAGLLAFEAVFNREAAVEYGMVESGHLAISEPTAVIAQRTVDWSAQTPKALTLKWVRRLLERDWTFAQDPVIQMLSKLGLPLPEFPDELPLFEGAKSLSNNGKVLIDRETSIDLRTAPYVMGTGEDFFGIWDRSAPGPPRHTFPLSELGYRAVWERWVLLLTSAGEPTERTN
jgi:hypothetical protein